MKTIEQDIIDKPYIHDFFDINGLKIESTNITIKEYADNIPYKTLENIGINKKRFVSDYYAFIDKMEEIKKDHYFDVESITIIGGTDKDGNKENINIQIVRGEIICLNGVTGSGKSRLLEDIEWLAQGDTPTNRTILVNNEIPKKSLRYTGINRIVTQLSQNMNFVMDINVEEFIQLHAKCRLIDIDSTTKDKILACANQLSGEKFTLKTALTSLSGGQSRALMIADAAFLSTSPIILIDEIENAGINKLQALNLLTDNEKIVLMATHDPVLALSSNKRIIIKNGGISEITKITQKDKRQLESLYEMDRCLSDYREKLRIGKI